MRIIPFTIALAMGFFVGFLPVASPPGIGDFDLDSMSVVPVADADVTVVSPDVFQALDGHAVFRPEAPAHELACYDLEATNDTEEVEYLRRPRDVTDAVFDRDNSELPTGVIVKVYRPPLLC